jgi:hypothetical protein
MLSTPFEANSNRFPACETQSGIGTPVETADRFFSKIRVGLDQQGQSKSATN